ncbi:ABCC9 protein, partial [Pseudoatta argentina]
MDFCKQYKFLNILPRFTERIVWSWQAGNGTVFQVPKNNLHSPAGCLIELTNLSIVILTTLVVAILIFKYKCSTTDKLSKSLLPLHTSRTLICILLLLNLLLELYESILTTISLSLILTIIAVLFCWILHRETEIRDGFGTAASGGGFAVIGLTRARKFLYLCRFGLSIQYIRVATTGITATCCGLLAIIDSYTLYRMKRIWLTFAAGSILKLCSDAMTLVGPMTIPKIVNYASNLQNSTNENFFSKEILTFSQILKNGYFLGIVVFLVTILQSTLKQASTHVLCVGGIRLRIALQALIYDKALRLSSWSISEEEKLFDKDKEHYHQQAADVGTVTLSKYVWRIYFNSHHREKNVYQIIQILLKNKLEERNLDAGNVFASLALFSQLTVPLFIFPVIIPIIINAMISTTRLEEFFQLPEIVNILPESNDYKSTTDILSKANSYIDNDTEAINSVTTFGSLDNIEEDEEDSRSSILREFDLPIDSSIDTIFEKDPEVSEYVLQVTPSTFTWGSDENMLMIDALNFPRGEIQKTSGSMEWTKGLKIAYVARQQWLQNATLRDNILFGSTYRSQRYRNVLHACALHPDVDILPGRDLTRIGERDQHVGQQIFDYGIKKLLLRNGRTVIMITHKLELLSAAHQIIVMDGCRVRAVGTKSSIEDTNSELAAEWRIVNTRHEDENQFQKTTKDRWSLIKLVCRIRMNKTKKHVDDGWWTTDRDAYVNPPAFVPLRLRRTTLSGSRYWNHVLTELLISEEEWDTNRKRSKPHDIIRLTSLQARKRPPPIFRQNSTPIILENRHVPSRKRNNTYNNGQPSGVLKQFFSSRYPDEMAMSKDKNVLSRLMSGSNKIIPHQNQHYHLPVKRLLESPTIDQTDDVEETLSNEDVDEQSEHEVDDKSGMVTRMIWMKYPNAGGWIQGLVYAIAALAFQILRVYSDFWLCEWMEESIRSPANTVSYFMDYIIISLGSIFLSVLYNVSGKWLGARARRKLHEEAIAGLLGAPISFFECNLIGKILSRFSADMSVIDKKMATAIKRLTSFVLLCGSVMIINIIISPWFLITVVPISCAYYALQKFYRRSARQLQCLDGSTREPVVAHFSETLSGLPTLRAFKQEDRFIEEMMKRLDINTNAFLILNTSSRWFGIALDYLDAVIVVVVISTALLSAELYPSRVTPKLVGLAINYTLLVPVLNWMIKFSAEIELYMGSVARICAYKNVQPEKLHENGLRIASDWPNRGEIVFENVFLRYDADRNPVITDLSLKIPAGQKLGICERTGSGKSSTVMALFQLIEISQGRILLDGIDIRQVPLRILRSRLSAIPQDAIMFSSTIRENLDPFSEHEDQEIWRSLELSQIKDVIASHPEGLNLEVRKGGENFSTGQLQLLCMARAILQRSSIVVFDEATSALDIATEKSLLKAATVAFEDRTVITIAVTAALLYCDRIIIFDEGKIIEEGSPADLMQRQNGVFSSMIKVVEQNGER